MKTLTPWQRLRQRGRTQHLFPAGQRALLAAACALACAGAHARDLQRMEAWPSARPVPAFALTDTSGHAWTLNALRGKVVVLNFWASWCATCVAELPELQALAKQSPDVVVLAVNYREGSSRATEAATDFGWHDAVLRDPAGSAFAAWGRGVLPATVLIDRAGHPRWRINGALADAPWHPQLERLLTP